MLAMSSVGAALFVASAVLPTPTLAESSRPRADRIAIAYALPKNPDHQSVYDLVKERHVLERLQQFLSPLRLPRPLLLKTERYDGEVNAWYEDDAVTVCYEYIADILQNAPEQTTPAGITRSDTIVGTTLEVFLHEVGHAVFDYLDVPILGREEDAADQLAANLLLQFGKSDARQLIAGVAYTYNREAALPSGKKTPFADEHGLPAQRFYNVICLAFGADPKLFGGLVTKGYLPRERAEGCDGEYDQVARAMKKLIQPHIDRKLVERVKATKWLDFAEPK